MEARSSLLSAIGIALQNGDTLRPRQGQPCCSLPTESSEKKIGPVEITANDSCTNTYAPPLGIISPNVVKGTNILWQEQQREQRQQAVIIARSVVDILTRMISCLESGRVKLFSHVCRIARDAINLLVEVRVGSTVARPPTEEMVSDQVRPLGKSHAQFMENAQFIENYSNFDGGDFSRREDEFLKFEKECPCRENESFGMKSWCPRFRAQLLSEKEESPPSIPPQLPKCRSTTKLPNSEKYEDQRISICFPDKTSEETAVTPLLYAVAEHILTKYPEMLEVSYLKQRRLPPPHGHGQPTEEPAPVMTDKSTLPPTIDSGEEGQGSICGGNSLDCGDNDWNDWDDDDGDGVRTHGELLTNVGTATEEEGYLTALSGVAVLMKSAWVYAAAPTNGNVARTSLLSEPPKSSSGIKATVRTFGSPSCEEVDGEDGNARDIFQGSSRIKSTTEIREKGFIDTGMSLERFGGKGTAYTDTCLPPSLTIFLAGLPVQHRNVLILAWEREAMERA